MYKRACPHTHTHTRAHTRAHTHTHTHTHTHIYIYIHLLIYWIIIFIHFLFVKTIPCYIAKPEKDFKCFVFSSFHSYKRNDTLWLLTDAIKIYFNMNKWLCFIIPNSQKKTFYYKKCKSSVGLLIVNVCRQENQLMKFCNCLEADGNWVAAIFLNGWCSCSIKPGMFFLFFCG